MKQYAMNIHRRTIQYAKYNYIDYRQTDSLRSFSVANYIKNLSSLPIILNYIYNFSNYFANY